MHTAHGGSAGKASGVGRSDALGSIAAVGEVVRQVPWGTEQVRLQAVVSFAVGVAAGRCDGAGVPEDAVGELGVAGGAGHVPDVAVVREETQEVPQAGSARVGALTAWAMGGAPTSSSAEALASELTRSRPAWQLSLEAF